MQNDTEREAVTETVAKVGKVSCVARARGSGCLDLDTGHLSAPLDHDVHLALIAIEVLRDR